MNMLTIVNEGSSLTIVNKGLSLTIINEGLSLTIVNEMTNFMNSRFLDYIQLYRISSDIKVKSCGGAKTS